ncbi:MAG: ATP-binding protein [Candidatus Thermoplasmatota archaeon]|jgi:predicted AAA+ superfamily ATPase|nr:ATP-binding protein [Candidatus Thermoplasmatota archaeon]
MSSVRDALLIQKDEIQRKIIQKYIKRDLKIEGMESDIIKVIIGPRRSGKSFLAMQTMIAFGNFGYANFDDETLVEVDDYNEIVSVLNSIYSNPRFLLLDEIQNLSKWELFVNRLQRQGYNLLITGSNSNLLSMELATHLTGRHLSTTLFPLSFREMIAAEESEIPESEKKRKFREYVIQGGYPEPYVKGVDYREYLAQLFESTIYKDIMKRYRIRKPRTIEDLTSYLLSNIAKPFSFNRLSRMLGVESVHTIKKYLSYLEEAFIFFELECYTYKLKDHIKSSRKIYCIDNGFITAKAFRISADTGRLLENLVAVEIKRRSFSGKFEFYFWKNQQQEEIDFVIKKGTGITELIQVCAEPSREITRSREVKALLKGSRDLNCSNLKVLTEDFEATEESQWYGIKEIIHFVPIWKWLLEP